MKKLLLLGVFLTTTVFAFDLGGMLNKVASEIEKSGTKVQEKSTPKEQTKSDELVFKELCKEVGGKLSDSGEHCSTKYRRDPLWLPRESDLDLLKSYAAKAKKEQKVKQAKLKEQKGKKYIEQYKKNAHEDITQEKGLCYYIGDKYNKYNKSRIKHYGMVYFVSNTKKCELGKENLKYKELKEEYNILKEYALKNKKEVKSLSSKYQANMKKQKEQKTKTKFAEFDKIREDGRVYAKLVMDTTVAYNKNELDKMKVKDKYFNGHSYKFAGLDLKLNKNKSGLIQKITLESSAQINYSGDIVELSMDKIQKFVNSIKSKYKLVDNKKEYEEYDLETVKNALLRYHNNRSKPNQANFNHDLKYAQAIKNQIETLIFTNKGDKIIVTVKTCIDGRNNTNYELYESKSIALNQIRIEYISKKLLQKENYAKQEKLKKEQEKKQKESSQMNDL